VYQGLIFASFNESIESLEDFLGGAKPWIDLFMKQGAGYPIKANGEHKFKFKGNWKIQLENTTDLYHFPVVHKSWMKSIDEETAAAITSFMTSEDAFCRSLGNGHSLAVLMPEIVDLDQDDGAPLPERFSELAAQLAQKHTPQEVRRIVRSLMGVGFNLNLFPNLALSMDAEAWERVQRGSYAGPDVPILVNRGLNRETTAANGEKTAHATDETGMREAYRQWRVMMEQA